MAVGSITKIKLKNGETRYKVRFELPSVDGRRRMRSRTVANKRAAEALQKAWIKEDAEGGLTAPSSLTVKEIATQWLDLARPRLRPKTYADYERQVARVVAALGQTRVQDVTPIRVQQQYRAWAEAGVGARSIELAHLRLRQILDLAVRWKIIRENPVAAVEKPTCKPGPRKTWSEDEARQFLAATTGSRFHLLWSLILATGLRRGEALGVRWIDLDLDDDAPCLRVRQTVELVGGSVRIGEPKTDAAKRTVDLLEPVADALIRQRAPARDRARFGAPCDLVFCTHAGAPLSPNNVYRAFLHDIERAGVPRITLHDLRRTFATIASARGVPLRELAAILGHAKPSVTMDIYAQPTRGGSRDAVGRVGRALFG